MSVSGPSPLGTLMVQRVEGALGVTVSQQANIATGARPDAVTQPGQPEKTDPVKNPPPKQEEGARQSQQGRQGALAALARNDPELARLLAARNAPMTSYTASAPTTLGQAAKTILALLQAFPDARPAVSGRSPLLGSAPGQGQAPGAGGPAGAASGGGATSGASAGAGAAAGTAGEHRPVGGNIDPRAVEALTQRAGQGGNPAAAARAGNAAPASTVNPGGTFTASMPGAVGAAAGGGTAAAGAALGPGGLPLAPTGLAGQLAQALSQAMQGSGLFYESHLREFAFGQRTLEQLRGEPQAQLGREAASNTQGGNNPARAGAEAANQAQSSQAATSAGQNTAAQSAQASAQLAGALLGMDPATHMLVRQQLEVLANQAFAWQGEPWPGGEMEWEVQRREPQGGGEDPENWSTRLKLNLPGLGEVVARLSLAQSQLIMHLDAPESAELIAANTGQLRERLSGHGLKLSQLTISRDSEHGDEAQP